MNESTVEGVSERTVACQLGSLKPDLLLTSQLSLKSDCSRSLITKLELILVRRVCNSRAVLRTSLLSEKSSLVQWRARDSRWQLILATSASSSM